MQGNTNGAHLDAEGMHKSSYLPSHTSVRSCQHLREGNAMQNTNVLLYHSQGHACLDGRNGLSDIQSRQLETPNCLNYNNIPETACVLFALSPSTKTNSLQLLWFGTTFGDNALTFEQKIEAVQYA